VDTNRDITLGRVSHTRATWQTVRYRERLWVPWWWWPPAFVPGLLIAPEVNAAARNLPDWISFVVLSAVTVAVLVWLSRTEVRVAGEPGHVELWAASSILPPTCCTGPGSARWCYWC
jgi:hypothetical protein